MSPWEDGGARGGGDADDDAAAADDDDDVLAMRVRLLEYEGEVRALRQQVASQREMLSSLQQAVMQASIVVFGDGHPHAEPPLHEAARDGDATMVRALIEGGVTPDVGSLETALQAAGMSIRPELVYQKAVKLPEVRGWGVEASGGAFCSPGDRV